MAETLTKYYYFKIHTKILLPRHGPRVVPLFAKIYEDHISLNATRDVNHIDREFCKFQVLCNSYHSKFWQLSDLMNNEQLINCID